MAVWYVVVVDYGPPFVEVLLGDVRVIRMASGFPVIASEIRKNTV